MTKGWAAALTYLAAVNIPPPTPWALPTPFKLLALHLVTGSLWKGSPLFILLLLLFFGLAQSMQKFPSQGWNLHHSSDQSHTRPDSWLTELPGKASPLFECLLFVKIFFNFQIFHLWQYSWCAMLFQFLVYSKVILIYVYFFLFQFFSIIFYYKILNTVSRDIKDSVSLFYIVVCICQSQTPSWLNRHTLNAFYWSHYTHLQLNLSDYQSQHPDTVLAHPSFLSTLLCVRISLYGSIRAWKPISCSKSRHLPSSWWDHQVPWRRIYKALVRDTVWGRCSLRVITGQSFPWVENKDTFCVMRKHFVHQKSFHKFLLLGIWIECFLFLRINIYLSELNLFTKQKTDSETQKTKQWLPKGKRGGEGIN